jgi:hypothetical protein
MDKEKSFLHCFMKEIESFNGALSRLPLICLYPALGYIHFSNQSFSKTR